MHVVLPTEEFIRQMHEAVIEFSGGRSGELHPSTIKKAVDRPKHYIYYEECNFHKVCAVILHTLARKHPFIDGNKRTALAVTIATYRLNGINLDYDQVIQGDFVDLMLWVVNDSPDIDEITEKLTILTNKYAKKSARKALEKAEYEFEIEE